MSPIDSAQPSTKKVLPVREPGFIYLYTGADDDLIHFCWRSRAASLSDPGNLDLVMVPTDGTFKYLSKPGHSAIASPTTGRVCVLKFASSEARYFFWLQSREQPAGTDNRNVFSDRDLKLVSIVDNLLQGEEVGAEVNEVRAMGRDGSGGSGGTDEDMAMDDMQEETGGAGPDATGGDVREEGEGSREGGADGGRANLSNQPQGQPNLASLLASINAGPGSQQHHPQAQHISTTLADLLPPSTTISAFSTAPISTVDRLLKDFLPPEILTLSPSSNTPTNADAAIASLSEAEKRRTLEKVLRSPQFTQALGSITSAIRDGGLTSVSEALGVKLEGKGIVPGTGEVVNGGAAVEVFLEALRKMAEGENA
ncbi:MAG: hypothetical protein Q9159_002072 [Coniocarpon cinnabarinum]